MQIGDHIQHPDVSQVWMRKFFNSKKTTKNSILDSRYWPSRCLGKHWKFDPTLGWCWNPKTLNTAVLKWQAAATSAGRST